MISAINSTINFKGIYASSHDDFTRTQKLVAEDIRRKLGGEIQNKDFYLTAGNDRKTINLSLLKGLRFEGMKGSKKASYTQKVLVGAYNKEHPYNQEDLVLVNKKRNVVIGAILGIALFAKTVALNTSKKLVSKLKSFK